ncbi:MAG: sigma-54-dependent Fis family transcriptional regulator [Betaproteobacteria bacterium]|uniref:Sigma-54-dependent Fis family transcriptional regulator n=1 Tax=Candidatus Proximibacter danicus TaxID=2954365 RepID=A0A9D7K076_9PROT|nr:sigma-54-dependent Fis family transcriptional regulator [Candidatus Proximibacter danicus]MBK9445014.1 sigma-54-dependent Fis family transcriptional regulator [Betaproteobacteria bacterium]
MTVSRSARRPRGELLRVLVVDDEADIRELLDLTLSRMGLAADCAATVAEARKYLLAEQYQLCLTDMRLPDGEGLAVVRLVAELCPQTPVAVITAFGSTENAVAALKAGAFDYLAKPVALDQLRALVKSALELPLSADDQTCQQLIGDSAAIESVREMIDKLARSQAPVYISGESGSGKELAARLVHAQSARAAAAFVPVNCGAIPESLVESEFFGYRKGAFTGADTDRDGFFQAANGGTLFLDEVADLPLAMQVKLLRAIQEKKVRKVGSAVEETVDVRIISATHRNLRECVDAGRFRQDLYYRLDVIELRMPALRERSEDVPVLVASLLRRIAGTSPPIITDAAMQALRAYSFPGNVRELENILERATALSGSGVIDVVDLQISPESDGVVESGRAGETLDDTLCRVERQAILDALAKTGGNRTAAARLLGVTFRSLRYRIERLGLDE